VSERVLPVIVVGACGRMGRALVREVLSSDDLSLVAAVDRSGDPSLGKDAGRLADMPDSGIVITDALEPRQGAVVVDFSLPEATSNNIRRCMDVGVPLVLGTTGVDDPARGLLRDAVSRIAVVHAPNFSVGVTLLVSLAALAARALGPGWDAELFELHHRYKRDAPSGTAIRIADAVAQATLRRLGDVIVHERRQRGGPRRPHEIGILALRGGDSVGEHTLLFLGDGERLELTHRASDRAIFARGALRAARWLIDKPHGLCDMADVLGLQIGGA
jgi:4-hydroxy-tetrahydrodipicolinate reductase